MDGGAMYTLLPKNPSTGLSSPSSSSSSSPSPNPVFPVSASYDLAVLLPAAPAKGLPMEEEEEEEDPSILPALLPWGPYLRKSRLRGQSLLCNCLGRVTRAFRLLQADPSVKSLVTALASDIALWEAIMNNESVRKLGQSLSAEILVDAPENGSPRIREEATGEPDSGSDNLRWLLDIVKERIMELIEKFKSLVNEIFQQYADSMKQARAGETPAQLEEKVRSSLLLSVVILLIVVLSRVRGA